jgi:hypothetical protein
MDVALEISVVVGDCWAQEICQRNKKKLLTNTARPGHNNFVPGTTEASHKYRHSERFTEWLKLWDILDKMKAFRHIGTAVVLVQTKKNHHLLTKK